MDNFSNNADTVFAPGRKFFRLTPSDSVAVDPLPKAIRADVAGTVVLQAVDSSVPVTITMSQGETLVLRVQYIKIGTTATVDAYA